MKIAIMGLGKSGLSAFAFLSRQKEHEIYLVNKGAPKSWAAYEIVKHLPSEQLIDQKDAEDILLSVDQIILSPGIDRKIPLIQKAIAAKVDVISEIELAFIHSDIPVVGITGTNGKTTTTTMLGEVLGKLGKDVFVCGNIGRPYCDILLEEKKYDYAIVELSSFQLESIKSFHPHIAIVLNITQNHAERYEHFEDYKNAKYNIFKNQTPQDYALVDPSLDQSHLQAKVISIKELDGFDFSNSKVVGEHNRFNFFCVYKVLEFLKLKDINERFQDFINEFKGVNLRLEFLTSFNGLKIYNDGKSTNDAATQVAVKSFQNDQDLFVILGGQLRSQTLTLNETLSGLKIKKIFAFGEAKNLIKENLSAQFDVNTFDGLEQIVELVKNRNLKGVLLFSPAFPSFDQYENYLERGEHFRELVFKLEKEA